MMKELLVLGTLTISTPQVIDGDTIKSGGISIRLINFNTPELFAPCPRERSLAKQAREELQSLLPRLRFELRPCATSNYGRLCAEAFIKTDESFEIPLSQHMIDLRLAEPYVCDPHCPHRKSWC